MALKLTHKHREPRGLRTNCKKNKFGELVLVDLKLTIKLRHSKNMESQEINSHIYRGLIFDSLENGCFLKKVNLSPN